MQELVATVGRPLGVLGGKVGTWGRELCSQPLHGLGLIPSPLWVSHPSLGDEEGRW